MPFKRLLRLSLSALFVFLTLSLFAQTRVVTGTVTNATDGTPVPGASVVVKGTSLGTVTDAEGRFSISVPENATTLEVSNVGFLAKNVAITGQSSVTVSLVSSTQGLTEVVVIGYGTRKVKDATGSVASLSTKDFNKGVIATPDQLLQGRTPGVIVSPSSGEPGAAATINIRGTASIRGNQEPLYVVDGVPISPGGTMGTSSGVEGSSTPRNPLAFLNPNDIESITVLKDASSAAIYGSRGANGVILITTKSGKGAKGSFQFGASTSVSSTAKRYDLLNGPDFLRAARETKQMLGLTEAQIEEAMAEIDKGANTDWQDEIFRTAISQNYNLGWGINRGGTSVRLSGSYDDQEGIIKNSDLKRLTARANIVQKLLHDKLKFETMLTFSNVKNQYPPLTNNAGYQGSLLGAAIAFNPTYPVYNQDGSFFDPGDNTNRNPVTMLNYFNDNDNNNRFLINLSGSYEITPGLVYKATFGYDKSKSNRQGFADPRLSSAYGGTNNIFGKDLQNPIPGNGRGVDQTMNLKTILVEHTLTWDKSFGDDHVINAVAGYGYQTTENDFKGRIGWGLNNPPTSHTDAFNQDMNQFKNYAEMIPWFTKYDLQSFFGRLNYTLFDKYLFTATFRADGSSKFGENNKYGYFPAFAIKWRLLNERFAESLKNTFSDFSIRANYGVLGSQEGIGPYDAVDYAITWVNSNGEQETRLDHVGNPDLRWEQAATTGVGLDFTTQNNRLSGTIDYYYTKRKDLLYYAPTPGGFAPQSNWWVNLEGDVVNQGLEFALNYKAISHDKFSWDVNYNMTFIKNELRNFPVDVITGQVHGQGLSGAYAQTFANGYPLFTWKMPVFEGFDENGYGIFANGASDQLLGSALPKFMAGLTNTFTIDRFTASVFLNAVTGFYVYNNTANALFLKGSLNTGHNVTYDAAFSKEHPYNPGNVSTRFLEKGDFLRVSNVNLSYNFKLKNTRVINSLSAFITGQNLALITNYSGIDPEVNVDKNIGGVPSRGFDYTNYPKPRTFSLGVNVGF